MGRTGQSQPGRAALTPPATRCRGGRRGQQHPLPAQRPQRLLSRVRYPGGRRVPWPPRAPRSGRQQDGARRAWPRLHAPPPRPAASPSRPPGPPGRQLLHALGHAPDAIHSHAQTTILQAPARFWSHLRHTSAAPHQPAKPYLPHPAHPRTRPHSSTSTQCVDARRPSPCRSHPLCGPMC